MAGKTLAALVVAALVCVLAQAQKQAPPIPDIQAAVPDRVLNVHAIAHTHADPGWLKTVDAYYQDNVRHILDTVVASLAANPDRRFTFVELSFFSKWWDDQSDATKELVRKLINNGQFDFTLGGWCMPDEATPTYTDLIDEMTAGHVWLLNTFGPVATPSIGWQIDPFGHSNGWTWLTKMMGFDMTVVMRIDYQDKDWRRATKQMEFMWKTTRSFNDTPAMNEIFTHLLYNWYNWPSGRSTYGSKVTWNMDTLANWLYTAYASSNTPELIAPMGDDFAWQNAEPEYSALDGVIEYFKNHPEKMINMFYSSPARYSKAVQSYKDVMATLPSKSDDFFGYSDYRDDYWSGYFTSHAAFKRHVRASSGFMHNARQIHALLDGTASASAQLDKLWHAVSVTQHHDAITGTAKAHVYDDYDNQLVTGKTDAASLLDSVMKVNTGRAWQTLTPNNEGGMLGDALKVGQYVALHNSLAWQRDEYVSLSAAASNTCVRDPFTKQAVASQRRALADGKTEVTFRASVAPLGMNTYELVACPSGTPSSTAPTAGLTLESESVSIAFDTNGVPTSFTDNSTGTAVTKKLTIDVLYYVPEGGPYNGRAGAYVMASDQPAVSFKGPRGTPVKIAGDVYQEIQVLVDATNGVSQRFRLYRTERVLRVTTTVGPIDLVLGYGKEVIVRFNTDVENEGIIDTDTHGLEFIQHKYTVLSERFKVENPISGNFYPVSLAGMIRDKRNALAVLPDRAQAFASLYNGSLEALVHRRHTNEGDYKGMGEPLDDKTVIQTLHTVCIEPRGAVVQQARTSALLQEHPLLAMAATAGQADPIRWEPLLKGLPRNIHLTTFHLMTTGELVIRLSHMYGVDDDADLSRTVTVDFESLFPAFAFAQPKEMTLTLLKVLNAQASLSAVTLRPLEVRTFVATLKRRM